MNLNHHQLRSQSNNVINQDREIEIGCFDPPDAGSVQMTQFQLVYLRRKSFPDFSRCLWLKVEGYGIEGVEQGAFLGMDQLQILSLNENHLDHLEQHMFDGVNIFSIAN